MIILPAYVPWFFLIAGLVVFILGFTSKSQKLGVRMFVGGLLAVILALAIWFTPWFTISGQ